MLSVVIDVQKSLGKTKYFFESPKIFRQFCCIFGSFAVEASPWHA
jgi:hypothetical protein